jgi:hypothetical protein
MPELGPVVMAFSAISGHPLHPKETTKNLLHLLDGFFVEAQQHELMKWITTSTTG